jgi:O-antigen/teichoic acid export membrane protein
MQGVCAGVRLAATMVLARWLTPEAFGLVATVAAFAGLLGLVRSMGLPLATLQRAELDQQQVSALFWINAGLGALTGAIVAGSAPLLAAFYGDARLAPLAVALAGGALLEGLALQHQALLRRQMRFAPLAAIETVAVVTGAGGALAAAALGAGPWALVIQTLGRAAASALGVWFASGWRPDFALNLARVAPMLSFGARLTAANGVNEGFRQLTDLLVGRFAGPIGLGLYSRATALQAFSKGAFSSPLDLVAIAGLSRLQDQPERYRRYHGRALLPPVLLGMPGVAFLFVVADDLVATLLGGQWTAVVPLFRALAPLAFLGTFNAATAWVVVSAGLAQRQLRWALFSAAVRLAALLAAAPSGLLAVALALSGATLALRPLAIAYCLRGSPLGPADVYRVLWRPALASLGSAAALGVALRLLPPVASPPLALLVAALLYGPLYLAAWLALPGGPRLLREQAALLRHLRGRRSAMDAALDAGEV